MMTQERQLDWIQAHMEGCTLVCAKWVIILHMCIM